jgi:glycosyltransferase involved in cell wall biosynthesis
MACKVPVITSNAGGLPELNINGVTGFMDNVGDIAAMAEHSIHILEDDKRLAAFKEGALKRAQEFDLGLILPIYEDYYREVIENSKAVI